MSRNGYILWCISGDSPNTKFYPYIDDD